MFTDKTNSRGGGLGGVRVRASERAHFPSDAPSSPWLRKPVSLAYYHIFLSHTIKQIILCCFHCPALVLVPLYYDASVVLNLDEGGRGAHLELRAHPQLTVIHPDQDPTKVGALQPQPTALWHQYQPTTDCYDNHKWKNQPKGQYL